MASISSIFPSSTGSVSGTTSQADQMSGMLGALQSVIQDMMQLLKLSQSQNPDPNQAMQAIGNLANDLQGLTNQAGGTNGSSSAPSSPSGMDPTAVSNLQNDLQSGQLTPNDLNTLFQMLQQLSSSGQSQQNPQATDPGQALTQLNSDLQSGNVSPQDIQNLAQLLQQAGTSGTSPLSGPGTGFPTNDAFQPNSPTGANGATGHHHHRHQAMRAVSQALGMSPQALRSQLQNGQSISDIAASQGKSMDDVTNAIQSDLQQRFPNATADQIAAISQRMVAQVGQANSANGNGSQGSPVGSPPIIVA